MINNSPKVDTLGEMVIIDSGIISALEAAKIVERDLANAKVQAQAQSLFSNLIQPVAFSLASVHLSLGAGLLTCTSLATLRRPVTDVTAHCIEAYNSYMRGTA